MLQKKQGETMNNNEEIEQICKQLDFLSSLLLAWDTDRISVDEDALEGLWQMVECIKENVKKMRHLQ